MSLAKRPSLQPYNLYLCYPIPASFSKLDLQSVANLGMATQANRAGEDHAAVRERSLHGHYDNRADTNAITPPQGGANTIAAKPSPGLGGLQLLSPNPHMVSSIHLLGFRYFTRPTDLYQTPQLSHPISAARYPNPDYFPVSPSHHSRSSQ